MKAIEDSEDAVNQRQKRQNIDWINKLKATINEIVIKNNKAPPLERLNPSELIVDLEEKERLTEEGEKQVKELKESIVMDNVARDLISSRIIKECWDSMEEQAVLVKAFKKKIAVPNYPLRKKNESEYTTLRRVMILRKIELKEFKQRKQQVKHLTPPINNISMSDSIRELELTISSQSTKKQSRKEINPDNEEFVAEEEESDKLQDLLYHPFDLHTQQRRINQITLLKWIITNIKKNFNKEIIAILELKKTEIGKIEEKNERIKEIIKELNESVEIFHPSMEESELPEQILHVKDEEVMAKKFMSEEDMLLTKQKTLELERSQSTKKDDTIDRGLKFMMGGTLEGRSAAQNFEEGELIKPDHLNKSEKGQYLKYPFIV